MKAEDIIRKYFKFFESKGHKKIEGAPLIPQNDPTTLFTSSGMQPLIKYFLGEPHPLGKRIVDVQNCFRAQDIDEVGDNRHTTFFRMLGNWSFGDYFKKEQLPWFFEFLTLELGLDPNRLYVSVFEGLKELNIPKDEEAAEIWKTLFKEKGIEPEGRIFYYGVKANWWSRSGKPENMPADEPGGPDSEVFYDFGDSKIHEESEYKNQKCHINCDCGRYLEIGNSVFMQYQKQEDGSFKELPQKNVDFGGGLERLLAAVENNPDIFQTNLFKPIIEKIEEVTNKTYKENAREMRIIADHLLGSIFMIASEIKPSNKEQGYILRRLIRRAIYYGRKLNTKNNLLLNVANSIIESYKVTDPETVEKKSLILEELKKEEEKFSSSLNLGVTHALEELNELQKAVHLIIKNPFVNNISLLMTKDGIINTYLDLEQASLLKELISIAQKSGIKGYYVNEAPPVKVDISEDDNKRKSEILNYFNEKKIKINSKWVFRFVTTFGVPLEILKELAKEKNLEVDIGDLDKLMKQHQELSRKGAEKKFKGGLADESQLTIMGHTATHLLHKALRDLLGEKVVQTGSNITSERVRFDFSFERKLTGEEIEAIEQAVNGKIKENLPVSNKLMTMDAARKIGAIGLFQEKYGDKVKIYFIGKEDNPYSKEFCGGPHVDFTGRLKRFKIIKQDNLGQGQKRIYAIVG